MLVQFLPFGLDIIDYQTGPNKLSSFRTIALPDISLEIGPKLIILLRSPRFSTNQITDSWQPAAYNAALF
jgi:hypothetical protein